MERCIVFVDLFPFYLYVLSTAAAAVIALFSFVKFFSDYREKLTSSALYLSIFFLAFCINRVSMLLRILTGQDVLFYQISNLFGPAALVFITAFAVSLVWPGKNRIGFAISIPLCAAFFISGFFIHGEVVQFYPRVYEVVYPPTYLVATILTTTALGLFVSLVFFIYARRVRWSSLRKGGFVMSFGFMLMAIFTYLLDWPGLFGALLPLTRLMTAIGVSFVYLGARMIQTARVPSV